MFRYIDIVGHTVSLYDFWNVISAAAIFLYMVFRTKEFCNISYYAVSQSSEKRKVMVGIDEVLAIIVVVFALFKIFNSVFGEWFTSGNANYFGSLTAWFIAITTLTIIFKTSPLCVHDMFAPALPIQLFFAKLACFCSGCCSGFEMSGSWYFNQNTDRYEFPVQLIEALVALALFPFLRWYQRRNRIVGSIFPIYVIVYSASRFVTEFLRADFPNVIGPFDAYQVLGIVYIFFGGVLLYAVCVHHQKAKILE